MNEQKNSNNLEEDINHIFSKSSTSLDFFKKNLIEVDNSEIIRNLKTVSDFNLFHLIRIKKYNFNNNIYGLIHLQLKYFFKNSDYTHVLDVMDKRIEIALQTSINNTGFKKVFVLMDFTNITSKNYSRKFIKLVANKFSKKYDDCLAICYVTGNIRFINLVWPFVSTLLLTKTKKKLVLLK